MTQNTELPSIPLPAVVQDFLTAHIARDVEAASKNLTDDIVIVDQGEAVRGRAEARVFLRDAGSEFEYTTRQIGARRVDDLHWVATLRLDGTFPGGVAELDYRFTLREGLVAELVIANHES